MKAIIKAYREIFFVRIVMAEKAAAKYYHPWSMFRGEGKGRKDRIDR